VLSQLIRYHYTIKVGQGRAMPWKAKCLIKIAVIGSMKKLKIVREINFTSPLNIAF